jgi:hypothetical protein
MTKKLKIIFAMFLWIAFTNTINAQDIDKNNLIKMWELKNYVIESKAYSPTKKEKDDYIHFKENMTFISKSEGLVETGTWLLNYNGAYIIMKDDKGEELKVYIIKSTKDALVLVFVIKEIKGVEVHYTSK